MIARMRSVMAESSRRLRQYRAVDREQPINWQARRSLYPRDVRSSCTAARRRAELTIFLR
jgi:hypothetical protein